MIEIQAAFLVLKKWNQNPGATKRQIEMIAHWPKSKWKE